MGALKLTPDNLMAFNCTSSKITSEIHFLCTEKGVVGVNEVCYGDLFTAEDGITYDEIEGYMPCLYTGCIGMYCPEGWNLTQAYVLGVNNKPNQFVNRSQRRAPLCLCTQVSAAGTIVPNYTNVLIRDDSPYGPIDEPACTEEYACNNISKYLRLVNGTCICCDKPSTAFTVGTVGCAEAVAPEAPTAPPNPVLPSGSDSTEESEPSSPNLTPVENMAWYLRRMCTNVPASVATASITQDYLRCCCYHYSTNSSQPPTYRCGLTVPTMGPGKASCVLNLVSIGVRYDCCAEITATGVPGTYVGEACEDHDAAVGPQMTLVAFVLLAVTLLSTVLTL